MKRKDKIIEDIEFTPDCQNKWDFDGPAILISSRGYDRNNKSFYVGYYLGEDGEAIIESELFDEDFDALKMKVRKWYKDHFIEAMKKAIKMLKEEEE